MYGLINEAMRRHVTEWAGADAWQRVALRAEAPDAFAGLHYYDDALTYALVESAATVLDTEPEVLLRGFGRYWTLRVGPESYADILGATGTDVVGVLAHLDEMHARLQTLYPELRPPSFAVRVVGAGTLQVDYRSERDGLAPFVIGLLEGLGELYGTPAEVAHLSGSAGPGAHDVFLVRLGQ